MPSRLDDELKRLVSAGVLRPYQADALRAAATADHSAPVTDPAARLTVGPATRTSSGRLPGAAPAASPSEEPVRSGPGRAGASLTTLLEVLGYIGGALLLGAVALLAVANWSEMGHATRISTTGGAAVLLLGTAVLLAVFRRRDQLSAVLAALGCCVAGFAASVAVEGAAGRIAGVALALVLVVAGWWWMRGAALLVALFGVLATGVLVVTADVLTPVGSVHTRNAGIAATGFILVAIVLGAVGLAGTARERTTAWALAGAAMFSSSVCWLVQDRGEVMALAVGTVGPAALLVAYGRHHASAYAVVGCSILLVIWPTALYQLTDNLAGVAIGLVVASSALLLAVVLLSRHRRARPT